MFANKRTVPDDRTLSPDSNRFDREVIAWLETPGGASLLASERALFRQILPRIYGPFAVQLGLGGSVDLLEASSAASRVIVSSDVPTAGDNGRGLRSEPEALPLATRSVTLVVLAHVLEFSEHPHQVLREVDRVLAPEGHLVIAGFNPYSLWGLRRLLARKQGHYPWRGRYLALTRVKDWLRLLDYDIEGGHMCHYRPPVSRPSVHQRLRFLESSGNRWWPMLAASYILVARKQSLGYIPVAPARWLRRQLRPTVVGRV